MLNVNTSASKCNYILKLGRVVLRLQGLSKFYYSGGVDHTFLGKLVQLGVGSCCNQNSLDGSYGSSVFELLNLGEF